LVVKFFKVRALYNRGSYSIYCVPHGYVKRLGIFHIGNRFVLERKVNSLQQQHRGSNTRFPSNLNSSKIIIFKLLPTLPTPPALTAMQGTSLHYQELPLFLPNYLHPRIRAQSYDLPVHQAITSRTSYSLMPPLDLSLHAIDPLVSYQVYHLSWITLVVKCKAWHSDLALIKRLLSKLSSHSSGSHHSYLLAKQPHGSTLPNAAFQA
jgi:hypothetical protein